MSAMTRNAPQAANAAGRRRRWLQTAALLLVVVGSPGWAQRAATPKPATAATQQDPLLSSGASGVLADPKAKAAYLRALGPLARERWLARLDGPSPMNQAVQVGGATYVMLSACKNHDCGENNAVFLYSAAQDLVVGKVYQRGRSTLVGASAPAVAGELERLWKSEWRSQSK